MLVCTGQPMVDCTGTPQRTQGTVLPIKRCLVRRTEDARVLHGNGVSEARGC